MQRRIGRESASKGRGDSWLRDVPLVTPPRVVTTWLIGRDGGALAGAPFPSKRAYGRVELLPKGLDASYHGSATETPDGCAIFGGEGGGCSILVRSQSGLVFSDWRDDFHQATRV